MVEAIQILTLTVAEFKRLKQAIRLANRYGIPHDVVTEYAFAQFRRSREYYDRMRFERSASK